MPVINDVVRLKELDPQLGVTPKNIGSVVDIIDEGKAYIVEFIDDNGETIGESLFQTYTEDQLSVIRRC